MQKKLDCLRFLAVMVIFRAPYDGDPSMWGNGTVVDESGAPITNVTVVRQDYVGVFHGGPECGHVTVTHSNESGRFFMAPWISLRKADDRRDLIAYRRGYVLTAVSKSGFSISMARQVGTAEERLSELNTMAMSAICGQDPSPHVVRLLEDIVDEEAALIENEQQRKNYLLRAQGILELERDRVEAKKRGDRE